MAEPDVSVLLPVRDGAAYLPECIESLRSQTLEDFEVLAVDDGSTDDSAGILSQWAREDPRVVVIRQPRLGIVAALEAGQAAGGDIRGMQSAALLIVKEDAGVWLNNDVVLRLQVDDNPEPIQELRRLVEMANRRWNRSRR